MDLLTCVFCVYLTGGLGYQSGYELDTQAKVWRTNEPSSNEYGALIGELELNVQKGYFYTSFKHISGINTPEHDLGLNSWMTGLTVDFANVTLKAGIGSQLTFEDQTNDYGSFLSEMSAMYEYSGLYAKASVIDDMRFISFGFVNRF